jgi:hypothetical protein
MTPDELTELRNRLKQAEALVAGVRDAYASDRRTAGARLLNEVTLALLDEIAELEKELAE